VGPAQVEFIKNEDYKYVRLLGAFYLRLVGKPQEVYQYLEVRGRPRGTLWRRWVAWTPPTHRPTHTRSPCTTTTAACATACWTATWS
jgi:hypothetical protein